MWSSSVAQRGKSVRIRIACNRFIVTGGWREKESFENLLSSLDPTITKSQSYLILVMLAG